MDVKGQCWGCAFFERHLDRTSEKGLCRRNAPQVIYDQLEGKPVTFWPEVDDGETCGEWKRGSQDVL